MKGFRLWIAAMVAMLLVGCSGKRESERLVSVTIEPQRFFAERIAGDRFEINCVVPAGQSPESYDPTPREMMRLGSGVAYLRIGNIGFEQAWMERIIEANPDMAIYDLSKGVDLIKSTEDHHDGEADEHHHHHHGDTDPHIWSSISGAKIIAKNTLDAFVDLDPNGESIYRENYQKLLVEIETVEREVKELLDSVDRRTFIIYHPALTYFAAEFDLKQLCIEMDGKEPSPAQLKLLVDTARDHDAAVVFVQREFDQKNAEIIAKEAGCRLITINPLNYNWDKEMIHIAKSLAYGKID